MREEVVWWLESSKKNLRRAERAFEDGDYAASVFWAHQTVQFASKAQILAEGKLPKRTHNLVKLLDQTSLEVPRHEVAELSPYYVVSRYPDIVEGVPEVERETAKRFLKIARNVVEAVERKIRP